VAARALERATLAAGSAVNRVLPVRAPERPASGMLCLSDRIRLLRATIRNWPLVAVDRVGPRGLVVTYRTAAGDRVRCRARSTDLFETVLVSSGYDYPAEFLGLDRPGDPMVVVDAGAHIGTFLLYVRSLLGDRDFTGIAIEPMAATFALLEQNCRLNGLTGVHLVQAALAAGPGTAVLRTDVPPDGAYLHPAGSPAPASGRGELVDTVELGALCADLGVTEVTLLKLDIEGSEYDVLDASWPFLVERVRTLVMEVHELPDGRGLHTVTRRLAPAFEVTVVQRGPGGGVLVAHRRGSGTADVGDGSEGPRPV